LLKKLNTNERTLQRLFKKYIGISPVQFRRLSQFQDAFQQLRKNEYDKLSDIAFEHGYADQSHFTRSFREFINLSPNEYLKHGLRIKKE
jgi:AraC-like DNA-binding protein